MTDNPYYSILEKILTVQQLNQCTQSLAKATDNLYKNKTEAKKILEETLPFFLVESLFENMQINKIPLTDIKRIQKLLEELQLFLQSQPVVEIVVAFIPNYRNVQKISRWWEEYTGTHVILTIIVDESVIAGAKISYAGIYKDYTLSNWFSQKSTGSLDQFL